MTTVKKNNITKRILILVILSLIIKYRNVCFGMFLFLDKTARSVIWKKL